MKGTHSNAWDNACGKFTLLSVHAGFHPGQIYLFSVLTRTVPFPDFSLAFL